MQELYKQVTYTNGELNTLHFAVEMLLKAQATTMACPPVMFAFVTLGTALPATSMVTTPRSVAKSSGHLTMDPAMTTNQQLLNMPVSIPFHDHH